MDEIVQKKLKILILSDPLSIHTIRWVSQLKNTGWEVKVLCPIPPRWKDWTSRKFQSAMSTISSKIAPINVLYGDFNIFYRTINYIQFIVRTVLIRMNLKYSFIDKLLDNIVKIIWKNILKESLINYCPDIVHSLGLNQSWRNLCQPILEQRKKGVFLSPWIFSSWGTDLSFYPNLSSQNLEDVKAVVSTIDFYIAESKFDYERAIQLGFNGKFLGYFPAFGGMEIEKMIRYKEPGFTSDRKIIYIKGRGTEDPVGKAMIIMNAIEELAGMLHDYQILIGQATESIRQKTLKIKEKYGLEIKIVPFLEDPDAVLNYVGFSKVFISITSNDGLPASLVESMLMGAFPIFSNLPSISEWIKHGENGFLLDLECPDKLVNYLRQALEDNNLVNHAAKLNADIIQEKLEYKRIRERVISMYQSVNKKRIFFNM